ncbi:MAG TPA: hypothetical protein VGJ22_04395 [Anaerolineales bacterium]
MLNAECGMRNAEGSGKMQKAERRKQMQHAEGRRLSAEWLRDLGAIEEFHSPTRKPQLPLVAYVSNICPISK